MGITADFNAFNENLKVDNRETVQLRYKAITKQLNTDFWDGSTSETAHSLYVGSYGRNTAIKGFSDLDMTVLLPDNLWFKYGARVGNGQSDLLQDVKESIRKKYWNTDLKGDGQVVVAKFADSMKIEVVPVFSTVGINTQVFYADTNNGGSWKLTDPKAEQKAFFAYNSKSNGNLVKLGRMMRAWRRQNNVPISGILLDTLAAKFLETYQYASNSSTYFDWMCRDFLFYLSQQNPYTESWPPLSGTNWLSRKGPFESRAKSAYEYSLKALEEGDNGVLWSYYWRQVFGDFFPR